MLLKVCGLKHPQNIREVVSLRPQMIGFIFYKFSTRYVGNDFKIPDLNEDILKVGVFVNEELEIVKDLVIEHKLDYVQLHGEESPTYCEKLKKTVKIIKAFKVSEKFDFNQTCFYEKFVEMFLFDCDGKLNGGNGTKFNWNFMDKYFFKTSFLLSGGINQDDLTGILRMKQKYPMMCGVDVNSGFEIEPGLKNIEQLQKFKNGIIN